jgi:aminomethyltransferase
MSDEETLARTPLHAAHQRAGARLVPFAGWEMPVQYTGVIDEHRAVRTAAGLFDVSHMGEVLVTGSGAEAFLQGLTPNDVSKLAVGRAHYSGLLTERGTYVDDLLVYRLAEDVFLLVVNASNRVADLEWIRGRVSGEEVRVEDVSDDYALLALQGPAAITILATVADADHSGLRYYAFARGKVAGREALISRTGYTGEDGFELYVAPEAAEAVWEALLAAGRDRGLVPAGLGARDTLRLEAAMALYGHELDRDTTPWEAGLDWVVKMGKGDFVGRPALARQKDEGPARALAGFEVEGRGIARQGHAVLLGDEVVGRVTSGTFSPTFERALGLAWVPAGMAEPGRRIDIEVRGRRLPARLVETPFYKRSR